MTVLSAQTIRRFSSTMDMITPFNERTVLNGKTFGLSSAGYDVRMNVDVGQVIVMSPGERTCRLVSTVEHFIIPTNVQAKVCDKSTWVRKWLTVQNTVIEPGWRGFLTLELIYHGHKEIYIQVGDPIAQIVFEFLDEPTEQPYTGKYQDQKRGPQEAIEEKPDGV